METSSHMEGFQLIELLSVMAILTILVGFSYPNYQHFLNKSRRSEGLSAVLDLANRMESYYTQHLTYASATIASGNPDTDLISDDMSTNQWYRLKIQTQGQNFYQLAAIPQQKQGLTDRDCQTLTINHLGNFGIDSGPAGSPLGTVKKCWYL